MSVGINTKTNLLMQNMAKVISNCGLPPCVVGLVLDKLRVEIGRLESEAIRNENAEAEGDSSGGTPA